MYKSYVIMMMLVMSCLGNAVQADVFNMGLGLTSLETVIVGDPGNAADFRYNTNGCGAVNYSYAIGKYEVTAAQYTEFLNAKAKSDTYGLYNPWMESDPYGYACGIQRSGESGNYSYSVAPDRANRPVNYVSFWDACRFTNWLHNGQGDGDTENGAYTLDGYSESDGHDITRNDGALWFIPSADEWYKAAYYKGGSSNAGYWTYATQSDVLPSNDLVSPDPGNNANFKQDGYTIGAPYYLTVVGKFENSESAYGTFDQAGNVYEWDESVYSGPADNFYRGNQGGAFNTPGSYLSYPAGSEASWEDGNIGFRVAAAVPEPSTVTAVLAGLGTLLALRRKR